MREIEADLVSLGVEYDPSIFEQNDIGAVISGVNAAINDHDGFIEPAPEENAQASLVTAGPTAQAPSFRVY